MLTIGKKLGSKSLSIVRYSFGFKFAVDSYHIIILYHNRVSSCKYRRENTRQNAQEHLFVFTKIPPFKFLLSFFFSNLFSLESTAKPFPPYVSLKLIEHLISSFYSIGIFLFSGSGAFSFFGRTT